MQSACLKLSITTHSMRHAAPFRTSWNIRLLRSREVIGSHGQLRQIFRMSRINLIGERQNEAKSLATIQKVVFMKKRGILFKDFLIPLGFAFIFSWTYNVFVLGPLEQAVDDPDLAELEDEIQQQPLFFPLPLTWKEIKQASYRGSDPEWQEFIKLSKQQDVIQQIRRDLANIILNAVKGHPLIILRVGNKMKVRRYWLDVDFPLEPPPEYTQSGIEIGNDYIAWTSQPVESGTVRKFQRILWPSSMTISTWNFTKAVIADYLEKIANMIGFKTAAPPTLEQILTRHRQFMKGGKISPHDGSSLEQQLYPEGVDVSPAPSIKQPKQNQENSQEEYENIVEEIMPVLRRHFSGPLLAFKKSFAKSWKDATPNPPRGCVCVSGLVEIETTKAYLIFDVMAHWNPQTKLFDIESLAAGLRRIQLKKQAPKDGF
ncbi:hypothetical protein OnM2_030042 [Erysiphe neolycopersici]|uniref:Uncharacterized protein n=1 Tax=Erysiphe neolycopersici TaxID=212602 RepID=A0A420HZG6_9PEZI|nr:hypothetical protein OnM2_030042 [Erysiphe neolycopersici]